MTKGEQARLMAWRSKVLQQAAGEQNVAPRARHPFDLPQRCCNAAAAQCALGFVQHGRAGVVADDERGRCREVKGWEQVRLTRDTVA